MKTLTRRGGATGGAGTDKRALPPSGGTPRPPSPENNGDQLPPHSPEAESGLLGCIMQEPGILDKLQGVSPGVFYDLRHKTVFTAIAGLKMESTVIDIISLQIRLKKEKRLEEVGGIPFLN
jgi:DnaB-like helicase N terminal domain